MKLTKEHSIEEILSICYAIPMGNPLMPDCIWGATPSIQGPPGIGKSGRVKHSGKTCALPVGIVELGGRTPEDAAGVPFLNSKDEFIVACLLDAVNKLNAAGKGVLFLDEINWARPNTQGAFLSAVQDRRIGDTEFSNFIRIVLASNPQRSAGGGHALIPPMANRCLHFDIEKESIADDDENDYLVGRVKPVTPMENVEEIVRDQWQNHWSTLVGQMIGFKERFSKYVLEEPPAGSPEHHKAWPSPRSRELALRAITTVRILKTRTNDKGRVVHSPLEDVFVEAACGLKMATDWAAYRLEADLPTPKDVLEKGWKPDPSRIDRTMAVYRSCEAFVLGRANAEEKKEFAAALWGHLIPLIDAGLGDLALKIIYSLANAKLGLGMGGAAGKVVKDVYNVLEKKKLTKYIEIIANSEGT